MPCQQSTGLDRLSAPYWTRRSVAWVATMTLGMYVLLPYFGRLSTLPEKTTVIRTITAVHLPPPAPLPVERVDTPPAPRPQTPQPELEKLRRRLAPLQAAMSIDLALGVSAGDFGIETGIPDTGWSQPVAETVFRLGDLDQPPRPLAQPEPVYPATARMRNIEGFVLAAFTVAADGTVRDIEVIASEPGAVFVPAALAAIRRWRFSPGIIDGEPVAVRAQQQLTFQLE